MALGTVAAGGGGVLRPAFCLTLGVTETSETPSKPCQKAASRGEVRDWGVRLAESKYFLSTVLVLESDEKICIRGPRVRCIVRLHLRAKQASVTVSVHGSKAE